MKDKRWTKRCTEWKPREREEVKATTKQKRARKHGKEGGNHLFRQKTMTTEALEGYNLQRMDKV